MGAGASIALVANPGSGSDGSAAVAGRLSAEGAEVQVFSPGDEPASLAASGADRLAVAGGDGSIAPVAEGAAAASLPLAVIPVGTANDFARAFGIPDDLDAACRLAVHGRRTRRLDLGRIGGRSFVNVASVGLPPIAAREAAGLKRALGSLAYPIGALRAGLGAKPVRCRVECDGREIFGGDAWQVSFACSGAFGGGASIAADPADGALDVAVLEAGPRAQLAWRAYGLRRGTIDQQDGVLARRCRFAALTVDPNTPVNVDGEVLRSGPTELRVQPGAFLLLVG